MNIKEATDYMSSEGVVYEQSPNKPEWYEFMKENGYKVYSATSGKSAFNEWYAAKDEEEMWGFIEETFSEVAKSQFIYIYDDKKYYHFDEVKTKPKELWHGFHQEYESIKGARIATIEEFIQAKSRF